MLVARAAAALHVRRIGRTGDLGKGQVFAADMHVALGIAGVQCEFGRAGLDGFQYQIAVKAHALRAWLDVGACFFQDFTRTFVHEVHAHFFQNGERGVVNRFQFVLRHHGCWGKAVLEVAVLRRGGRNTDGAASAPCASARWGSGC